MFRRNDQHRQIPLFSGLNELPPKLQKRLEESWAGTLYSETFVRIDEERFAVLYSDDPSRPNIPVNVLVGLEILKAGFGWSDQEMYENFCFNVQVRYALGYRDLGAGHFELRTIYNFRQRVARHMQETAENLFEQAFEQITDEQLAVFALHTNQQRMDSTQIASNIRETTRLQLLVEVLQRVHRSLTQADQEGWADEFAPYLKGSSGQYIYRLKGKETYNQHLRHVGELMSRLVDELAATYADEPAYQMLVRVFNEHFTIEAETFRPKQGSELSASSLQSPDDMEATYRQKRGEDYTGYVVNVTETCHSDNDFQLIVKVQTEPNNTDDAQMLAEALPELKRRTDLDQMNTDGGYNSPEVDQLMRDQQVEHVQTAIRGRKPAEDKFSLAHCQWEIDPDTGQPITVTAPNGPPAQVEPGRKPGRFIARFHTELCSDQTLTQEPTSSLEPKPPPVLYFSQQQVDLALRRQRCTQARASGKNPRAAVEATVAAIKRPFGNDKVPVRAKFRVSIMMIGSAAMVNLRRIWRHQRAEAQKARQKGQRMSQESSFSWLLLRHIRAFLNRFRLTSCFTLAYS
jgi:hypothetical protein